MGRRRKWRWREVIPNSTCICFRRKERQPQWQAIAEDELEDASPRRGGMSYDKQDKNALYVRTLADVKEGGSKAEVSASDSSQESRRVCPSLNENDRKLLQKLDSPLYPTHLNLRFASLHKARRKQRPTISVLRFSKENASILDMQYAVQAKCLLSTVYEWNFSIFTLDKLTNGRSLFHVSLHLFQEHHLIETFNLDFIKLMRCISLIEEGYHSSNPYHNSVHAADVGQAMHCYLTENKLAQCLTPLEKMAAIFSAITHDLDHPGVNQAFLIATSNPLAALYNNSSVLENHHWRTAMGVLHESGLLDHCPASTWSTIEWQLQSLILATDITRQQEFLARFRGHLDRNDLDLQSNEEHRNFILQIALKCADICNPCRSWEISKRWSESVCDEFFKQGDYERKLQLPVTPLCDRQSTTVAKIQVGFMQFVVLPLFSEWRRFNPSQLSDTMIENIHTNKTNWEGIQREAAKALDAVSKPETVLEEEEEEEEEEDEVVIVVELEPDTTADDSGEMNSGPSSSNPLLDTERNDEDDEVVNDLNDYNMTHLDIMESVNMPRRHSLPPPMLTTKDNPFLVLTRRESFPRAAMQSRRHSLPVSNMHPASFDRLVDKLSALAENSPSDSNGNGSHFDFGESRPKGMKVMSVSLDTNTLSSARWEGDKQTSAHGLDPLLLAQRSCTSEPQIPHTSLAQSARLNSTAGCLRFGQGWQHRMSEGNIKSGHVSSIKHQDFDTLTSPVRNHCSAEVAAEHHRCSESETQPLLQPCIENVPQLSPVEGCQDAKESPLHLSANHYNTGTRHHSVPLVSLAPLHCPLQRHSIATTTLCSVPSDSDTAPLLQDLVRVSVEDAKLVSNPTSC